MDLYQWSWCFLVDVPYQKSCMLKTNFQVMNITFFWKKVNSHVAQVQSCSSDKCKLQIACALFQNFVCLDFLSCFFMCITLKQEHDFSCNLVLVSTYKFFRLQITHAHNSAVFEKCAYLHKIALKIMLLATQTSCKFG